MPQVEWIKLSTTTFDDEKIRLIEVMPAGDSLLIVWQKLLCQAGKTNDRGHVYLVEGVPFTPEMLSAVFRKEITIINTAIDIFRKFGMIEIDGKGIRIVNWDKHQNVDGMERIREQNRKRQQERRQKLKQLPQPPEDPPGIPTDDSESDDNDESRDTSRDSHNEVTDGHGTEKDLDLEKDIITDKHADAREEGSDLPFEKGVEQTEADKLFFGLEKDEEVITLLNHAAMRLGVTFLKSPDEEFLKDLLRKDNIPLALIIQGIDESFRNFEHLKAEGKKHPRSKITRITYCEQRIAELDQQRKELLMAVTEQAAGAESPEVNGHASHQNRRRGGDPDLSTIQQYSSANKL